MGHRCPTKRYATICRPIWTFHWTPVSETYLFFFVFWKWSWRPTRSLSNFVSSFRVFYVQLTGYEIPPVEKKRLLGDGNPLVDALKNCNDDVVRSSIRRRFALVGLVGGVFVHDYGTRGLVQLVRLCQTCKCTLHQYIILRLKWLLSTIHSAFFSFRQ